MMPKVEMRNNATVISTATTTVCKTGAGLLHTITVTGGTAGTIVVYDNTAASGTIPSFSSTNALATYTFNVSFSIGLTVVTSAATLCYCFRSLIYQHYEPTNRYKSSQWWWSSSCRKSTAAIDLDVDLTNSIIPQRGIGAVTYSRASIASLLIMSESFVNVFLGEASFSKVLDGP